MPMPISTSATANNVSVIDTTSNTITGTISGFSSPQGVAVGAVQAPAPVGGGAPGAYTSGSTRFVVYTGPGGSVWEKTVASPEPAAPLGGPVLSAPFPINAGGTRIVFASGLDNSLMEKVGGGAWTSLGGFLTSQPAAAVSSGDPNDYRVYARGRDGAVWGRAHTVSGWGGWYRVGGELLNGTGPGAAAFNGGFFVLVVGTGQATWIAEDGVSGFIDMGALTTVSPALVFAPSLDSLVLIVRGLAGAGWFRTPTSGWQSQGGILTSGMGGSSTVAGWFAYGLGQNSQVFEHAGTASGSWRQVTP